MKILSGFFTDELAVDLGTVNTLIYAPNQGIVLNEPSAVAIQKYSGEVVSVGGAALKLLGREPHDIEVHRPIRGGTIDNFEVTQKLLRAFIQRAHGVHPRRSHLVVGIPGAATPVERRAVRDAARDARAGRVDLIDEGLAAAFGAGLDVEDEHAHLIVDIGGGTTNIAIIASGGIISSASLLAAGNAMDEAVRDYVRVRHGVQIGERTSERLKIELGAASDGGDGQSAQMEIVGKQLANGAALPVEIGSDEVRMALEPVLAQISAAVRRMIEDAKPEVTADIYYSGVVLTGGGALLKGMSERLQMDLSLHVATPDDPLTAVALGAGRLLGEPEKLQRAAIRQDAPVWEEAEKLIVNW
ncbi:MAG: rod shape-determining protein MreB [Blastocatellia bacterium]|jgi:rod shape-determining protein MreB|nr:rod shape-determining protein MreB [Blastocatellia bacterium]